MIVDELRLAAARPRAVRREQELDLALAADEGRGAARRRRADALSVTRPHAARRQSTPPGFPFASTVARLVELERAAAPRRRALADEDLARLGRLLEPRRDVHRVAGHERAALARRDRRRPRPC